jgi:hypothetical protein
MEVKQINSMAQVDVADWNRLSGDAHWLKDAGFTKAIEQFIAREQKAVQLYKQDAASFLPFKQET